MEFKLRTQLARIKPNAPAQDTIALAVNLIRTSKAVAIPSDTLCVLVADPFYLSAVASVFRAKGHESNHALPILVDSLVMAEDYAVNIPERFYLLAHWLLTRAALTIIVPASTKLPLKVTSANKSSHPTCRSGIEVFGTMCSQIYFVLNGGLLDTSRATTVDITERQ